MSDVNKQQCALYALFYALCMDDFKNIKLA